MISWQARVINFLLHNRHVFSKTNEKNIDWTTYEAVQYFRRQVEEGAGKFGKFPADIEVTPVKIGEINAEWLVPQHAPKNKVILYFHGGGYISGTCHAHRSIASKFVKNSGISALLFEYRLAPENPFPAALEDSLAVYQWLLDQEITTDSIVFIGDSAGGGLALTTLVALRDNSIPLPSGAAVYSPVTDFSCSGESYKTNLHRCMSPPGMGQACAGHYAGDQDPRLPYISPLFADLSSLPDLLLFVGGHETLLDDSVRFVQKAKESGVNVTFHIGEGLFHCYPAMSPLFPEARQAMDEICMFVRSHINE